MDAGKLISDLDQQEAYYQHMAVVVAVFHKHLSIEGMKPALAAELTRELVRAWLCRLFGHTYGADDGDD
jgi:hypothetical protein